MADQNANQIPAEQVEPVPLDEEVEGHGVEEDDAAEGAESFTATGVCADG